MPEGHTIHALAGRLERAFGGRPVEASSPQGRFSDEAKRLDGEVVQRARAVGKHLFVEFPAETLHVHLGLIGSFPVKPLGGHPPVEPRGALRLRLLNDDFVADLRGPIACELLGDPEVSAIEAALGPDPLDPTADGDRAWDRIRLRRKTIAELLMDQSVLAGVGNVYRAEALFRAGVDPYRPGSAVAVRPVKTGGPPGQAAARSRSSMPGLPPGLPATGTRPPDGSASPSFRTPASPMRSSTARSAGYCRTAVVMAA